MSERANHLTAHLVEHLKLIQAVIIRHNANCFALKATAGAITAGVLALAAANREAGLWLALAALVVVAVFWMLDAQYLRNERLFRRLYDGVRTDRDAGGPFSMDIRPYQSEVGSVIGIAFSWSVLWFYGALVLPLLVLVIVRLSVM